MDLKSDKYNGNLTLYRNYYYPSSANATLDFMDNNDASLKIKGYL